MNRSVIITGIGVIAPNGIGAESFFHNCIDGVASAQPLPSHWHHYCTHSSPAWAPLPKVDYSDYGISRIDKMQMDPSGQMGIAASVQALNHAGIGLTCINERKGIYRTEAIDPLRAGVYIGTGIGGLTSLIASQANHVITPIKSAWEQFSDAPNIAQEQREPVERGFRMPPRFNPFVVSMTMPNAPAALLGIRFGLRGPNQTTCHACAAGSIALGNAFEAIAHGKIDIALAGGVEYLTDDFGGIFRGFDIAGTLARGSKPPDRINRPFDRNRSGFLFAEGGCGVMVLESASHAEARGAAPIAELAGFAESFDAHSLMMMDPSGEAIERMLSELLVRNDITPDEIDYINAHGTGTELNDRVEAEIIGRIFGNRVRVGATKSLIGHTLGASGALATAFTAMALNRGKLHACKNLEDPEFDLNFVRTSGDHDLRYAIVESFAFGGHNAGLLLKRA